MPFFKRQAQTPTTSISTHATSETGIVRQTQAPALSYMATRSIDIDEKEEEGEGEKEKTEFAYAYDSASPVSDPSEPSSRRRKWRRYNRRACFICAGVVGVLLVTGAIWAAVVESLWQKYEGSRKVSETDSFILSLASMCAPLITEMSSYLSEPSMDTVDVIGGSINVTGVKRIWGHSHNDEMQEAPLITALSQGFGSIEADVWLIDASSAPYLPDEVLWVGHENKDLRTNQTFYHIYVKPLVTLLDAHNNLTDSPNSINQTTRVNSDWVGVYPSDPRSSIQLVIDIKNSPEESFAHLYRALRPLRDRGYLSSFNTTSNTWTYGAITVIGTGDTPLPAVYYSHNGTSSTDVRTIFYDAPLLSIHKPFSFPTSIFGAAVSNVEWTNTLAPMASSKFPIPYNAAALLPPPPGNAVVKSLTWYADQAGQRGIRSRWWGAARQPGWVRRRLWAVMLEAGNAWVNADDLEDARRYMARHPGRNV